MCSWATVRRISELRSFVTGGPALTFRLEHESNGAFLEIVRSERVLMSWRWKGGVEDPGESRIEITLKAVPEGTELTFVHSRLHDEESRRGHERGWTGSLDKLEALWAQELNVTAHV